MRPCLVHPRESECNVTTTVGRHENGTPEYQHLAAMVCKAVNDGSGVSGFPGHSEESWRRICLPLSRRQSRRHCARCSSISWRHACSARGHGLPVRTNARSCWLDLCQRGGGACFQHTRRGASCRTQPSGLILSASLQVHVRSSTL